MHLRLWSDELDEFAEESRAVVGAGLAKMAAAYAGPGERPADRDALLAQQRAAIATTFSTSPDATDRVIEGVRCQVVHPAGGAPATAVYLHFHGGGMIMGAPEMNTMGNVAMSRAFGMAVVSVDYRLAPEHPFPAGPDDGMAVAHWLVEHGPAEFGTDRIIVGGESAGGYMAAAVVLRMRDEFEPEAFRRVLGANLVFGVYDWGGSPSQRGIRPHEGPDMLDPAGIEVFTDCYLPGMTPEQRRDPAVSPLYADLRGLPPALFSVGSCDHLFDDTVMLAARWAVTNQAELFVAPFMPHGFMQFPCTVTNRWMERVGGWFAERLGSAATP